MNIPVYKIIINEFDETGCTTISLVDNPAVELPFLCFAKEQETNLFFADNDRHIISGIAMLADTPIYRCNPSRGEYYIVFTKETIQKMVQKFAKNNVFNLVNLQHDSDTYVNSVHMVESIIIDKERGLCPHEFKDVPDGSWYVSYHVEDDALWNEIKNGKHLNGFSIEILSELELFENKHNTESMNKIFKLAKMLMKLAEIKTDKETLIIDGEIEVGKAAFIETENGPEPAADGEYKLEDETVIRIVEGVITEIIEVEKEPEAPEVLEEEVKPEENPDPRIEELEARIKELEAVIEEKDAKIAELEAEIAGKTEELEAANAKLRLSVEEPITKKNDISKDNKALKYFAK